jgi:hypothetical protein
MKPAFINLKGTTIFTAGKGADSFVRIMDAAGHAINVSHFDFWNYVGECYKAEAIERAQKLPAESYLPEAVVAKTTLLLRVEDK